MPLYVQYGCGLSAPDGWVNFDVSPTLRLQRLPAIGRLFKFGMVFPDSVRYGDIVTGLPIADNSADGVYASHVLEHLSYDDFWIALENTKRILKPGGVFRLIVPDLQARASGYLERLGRGEAVANNWFMKASHLGKPERARDFVGRLRSVIGNSAHLWMWDEPSMREALAKAGFVSIRRAAFNDSEDASFRLVEDAGRFYDGGVDIQECAMEARKPGV